MKTTMKYGHTFLMMTTIKKEKEQVLGLVGVVQW
jgi:hypothetical protein